MTDTRALTQNERDILIKLLPAHAFPGADALAKQVVATSVVSGSEADFLDLSVGDAAEPAALPDGPTPISGLVAGEALGDAAGEPLGEMVVWVERGRLSGLEHIRFVGESHLGFPPASRVTAQPRR